MQIQNQVKSGNKAIN